MADLLYIDTNIFMDHFDGRVDRLRPLGEFAFQLLKRSAECHFDIIISTLLLEELFYNLDENRVKELLSSFDTKGKILRAEISQSDMNKARRICHERKTPFNDTLHAVIANRMKATFFVTRNMKDFVALQDLVVLALPENL